MTSVRTWLHQPHDHVCGAEQEAGGDHDLPEVIMA